LAARLLRREPGTAGGHQEAGRSQAAVRFCAGDLNELGAPDAVQHEVVHRRAGASEDIGTWVRVCSAPLPRCAAPGTRCRGLYTTTTCTTQIGFLPQPSAIAARTARRTDSA